MARLRTALTASLAALALAACGAQSSSSATAAKPTPAATTTKAAVKTLPPTKAPATTSSAPAPTSAAPTPSSPAPVPTSAGSPTSASPSPTAPVRPHFDTPQAAMTYLATAWNTNNMVDLKHVTQGAARELLLAMHKEAVNLRLNNCALRKGGNGDYLCTFDHDYPSWYPKKYRKGATGTAQFIAAPSSSVGWYMFAYEGCG